MGTFYGYNNDKQEEVNSIINNAYTIDHALRGNQLWTVEEHPKTGVRHLTLYKLTKSEGYWGYKPMSVQCHPYYYNCPERLVIKATVEIMSHQYSKDWLSAWIHHNKNSNKAKLKLKEKMIDVILQAANVPANAA